MSAAQPRRVLARAFAAALGPRLDLCTTCGGEPHPPMVRLAEDMVCAECRGRLDEEGRPMHRYPLPPGAEVKVIILVDDEDGGEALARQ